VTLGERRIPARTARAAGLALCVACCGVFVTLAIPRAWINDDAFITFRYAAHVATGQGIVWNIGAPHVEGSTSLAWTWLNAAAIRLGIDPLAFSHVAGLASGVLALVLAWAGAWRVLGLGPLAAIAAPAFLCAQRQFVLWSVSGMEMSAAALIGLGATLLLLQEDRAVAQPGSSLDAGPDGSSRGRIRLRPGLGSGLLFLLGSLFRPETPLLHLGAGVGILVARRSRRALALILGSGLVHAASLLVLTGWRLAYFGQALPNPFYVKVGALQLRHGLRFLGQFGLQNHAWLWGGAILLAIPWLWRRARVQSTVLALQLVAACVWLAAIGGDGWEFRFLVPVLPMLALLFALALSPLTLAARIPARAAGTLAVIAVFGSQLHVLRAGFHKYADAFSVEELADGTEYMGIEATLLSRYLTPQDRICTGWAGTVPYLTGAWHLDPWGLNAPDIARRPLDAQAVLYHQRHAEWSDVVANQVMFCDLFNHFLFPQPFDPKAVRAVVPWVDPGVPVYSVRLMPEGHFWLFTSARPRDEVESWLAQHGLQLASVSPLPAGWPRLGAARN
jgi:arabinofuranosyltransferase